MKSLSRYFYNSWIQACGEDWTRKQVGEKIGRKGELGVIIIELFIVMALILTSFLIQDRITHFQVFGIAIYCFLILTTLILIGMFLQIPEGFEWLIPLYFLKH